MGEPQMTQGAWAGTVGPTSELVVELTTGRRDMTETLLKAA